MIRPATELRSFHWNQNGNEALIFFDFMVDGGLGAVILIINSPVGLPDEELCCTNVA